MRSFIYCIAVAAVVGLAACAKKDSGGVADTPQCNVPNINCSPQIYSQMGYNVPPVSAFNGNGYCGCTAGTRPIYNPSYGISCAPDSFSAYAQYVTIGMVAQGQTLTAQNTYPLNQPQQYYSGVNPGGYAGSNCFQNFAYSCDVRNNAANGANGQCNGGYCRAISGGSTVGVCSTTQGYDSGNMTYNYNTPYNSNNLIYGYPNYLGYGGGGNCQMQQRQTSWGGWYYISTCDSSSANGVPR